MVVMKSTIVIGHKNPDTDSICSAICYAYLKHRLTGEEYDPCRAGEVNGETKYVLDKFCVPAPRFVESLEPTIADVPFRRIEGIDASISLKRAWEHMRDENIQTVPILSMRKRIRGILTLGDQARFYMEDQESDALSKAKTPYINIADTLRGDIVVGKSDDCFNKGKVIVAAANPDLMGEYIDEGDMVILGNRSESQLCAIELKASCLIVCLGAKVSPYIIKIAEDAGCTIITSPLDTYTAAKLINQSVPVGHLMRTDNIITFSIDDAVADVKATVSKLRIRYFPVLDADGHYVGMISQRNLLDVDRRKVILVDHNEKTQAVDGIEGAEILEIIDHHRLRSLETISPVFFRNMPLGSTSTIIYLIFKEKEIEIPKQIAGILLAAIISDTLMFRSPTSTKTDEEAGKELAKIAGEDIEKLADAMFEAGSDFKQKSIDEIFNQDFKTFDADGLKFGVSQISSMNNNAFTPIIGGMREYLQKVCKNMRLDMAFVMLTDIPSKSTLLLYSGDMSERVISLGMGVSPCDNAFKLSDVVSRKKQLIPGIISGISAVKNS